MIRNKTGLWGEIFAVRYMRDIGYKILDNLRVDLGYNFIIMESTTRMLHTHDASSGSERDFKFQTDNAYSHIAALSVTYNF